MNNLIHITGNNLSQNINSLGDNKILLTIEGNIDDVSDTYHTIDELYSHRIILFIALMKGHVDISWKSRKHSDGEDAYRGWFVAGIQTPEGDISYHLPNRYWETLSSIKTLETAPSFDGHTSIDVLHRLSNWVYKL
jgi:hypothetical protein